MGRSEVHVWLALLALLLPTPSSAAGRATTPPPIEPDGWWTPARDPWSAALLTTSFTQVGKKPAPSAFLGDETKLQPFLRAEWAWFAAGFDPEAYARVAVAPPMNGMGRYKVTGQRLLRDEIVKSLGGVTKRWKRMVNPGTDADLVVYTNVHWYLATDTGVRLLVENLGVNHEKKVVFKLQYVVDAPLEGTPDDKARFGCVEQAAETAADDLRALLTEAATAVEQHLPVPTGPAPRLSVDRATLVDPAAERFGPALTNQVAALLEAARAPTADAASRAERLRDLGRIGATAALPLAESILRDAGADAELRKAAAWALGEIGHPDALSTLLDARGVDRFTVKTAIQEIDAY